MTDESQNKTAAVREHVLNSLALIHLSEAVFLKRAGEKREAIAYDLLKYWLDDVYSPGLRYMDGLKGDRDESQATRFKTAFSEEENEWLERFNRFLELRIDRLSAAQREAKEFPLSDTWNGIVRDARNLILLIEPGKLDGKKRLDRVAGQISSGFRSSLPPVDDR